LNLPHCAKKNQALKRLQQAQEENDKAAKLAGAHFGVCVCAA
jgi:hypothetical protein